jgi:hypothetical protein
MISSFEVLGGDDGSGSNGDHEDGN